MSPRPRARFGLLALLLAIPLATAQTLPIPLPATPPSAGTPLSIHEGPFTFEGTATNPTLVLIVASNGSRVLEYRLQGDGHVRLDVAGENAVADATLVRVEGDPRSDSFTLVVRDPAGLHEVAIDRALLRAYTGQSLPEAPVKIERPPAWPGAPQRGYLLHVKDSAQNQIGAGSLTGDAFLQRVGPHRATLQIPHAENEWDSWFLQARREGRSATLNASFALQHATRDASVLVASFSPTLLDPADGERIQFDVVYEKRITPLVAERFLEPATYRYRVDGAGPTVSINAPSQSIDFRFTVTWSGSDALSGVGSYVLYYREAGTTGWIHWFTTAENGGIFSGDWGKTYELRARSLDRVGNPSAEALATTRIGPQPDGEDDVNDPPTARLLTPLSGAELAGPVAITWRAGDPDETPVTSRVEVSADDGETYRLLYVGRDLSTTWDTTAEADGPGYRIKLTVSDGTQSASDLLTAIQVRNVIAPPPPGTPDPTTPANPTSAPQTPSSAQPASSTDEPATPAGGDEGGKGIPAPFVGIAIVVAALLARRKHA